MERIDEKINFAALYELVDNLNEDQIIENLLQLFVLKRRTEQNIRDLVSRILNELSTAKLASCYKSLVEIIRSPYAFERNEAEALLKKIEPELIFDQFDYLLGLEGDSDCGIQRFATAEILRIAADWSIKEKKGHHDLISGWQKSKNPKKVEVANLITLELMELWDKKELEGSLPFLINCTDSENSLEVTELAVSLTFKFLVSADLEMRLKHLDFIAGFNDYADIGLRRAFRHLALETMKSLDVSEYPKYSLFFLRCLEAKNKEDRTMAWKNLLQINPDNLPLTQLVYCQVSGLYRVRRAGRKLAKRVSNNIILENFEELLRLQSSECFGVMSLSRQLILGVPLVQMKHKKEILEKHSSSRSPGVKYLTEVLLEFC